MILVSETRGHAEALLPEVAEVLSAVGLRLSEEKTLITDIDEGLDFLGWHIQRHQKREPAGSTSITTRPRRHFGPSRPKPRRSAG